jgi:hypothetical protein
MLANKSSQTSLEERNYDLFPGNTDLKALHSLQPVLQVVQFALHIYNWSRLVRGRVGRRYSLEGKGVRAPDRHQGTS